MSRKSTSKPKIEVFEPEEIREPRNADTFNIGLSEGFFNINFGKYEALEKDKLKINVVSRVIISDTELLPLVISLFEAALKYEKDYNKEIIPKKLDKNTNKNEEVV